jgi:hypothetical protein
MGEHVFCSSLLLVDMEVGSPFKKLVEFVPHRSEGRPDACGVAKSKDGVVLILRSFLADTDLEPFLIPIDHVDLVLESLHSSIHLRNFYLL